MCGLAGFWERGGLPRAELDDALACMTTALVHRGPDDHGMWVDSLQGVALGHRRLSVLDLSEAGSQPMVSASTGQVLVFNGEIYNYRDLRAELEREGASFSGSGDTEVVLAAIAAWGMERALERFVGMFALAVWDPRERELLLARDRLGIKPLFFGENGGTFFFASELKALRRHPRFTPELDRDALALYFRHNYVPAPHCIYRGIRKLEPGTWMRVGADLEVREQRYWDLREVARRGLEDPCALGFEEACDEMERCISESVRQRLVSDVPLGAFLSGGIDSSAVVALMQKHAVETVRTFTIGFEEEGFDEAAYAREVARHLGTDHNELYVTPSEARDVIPTLADHWDEPFSDSSQIPTLLVSRFARQQVTVCLSGDGGDEVFGGYRRYAQAARLRRLLLPWPALGRALGSSVLESCAGLFRRSGVLSGRTARRTLRMAELLRARSDGELYRSLVSHWRSPERLVLGAREPDTRVSDPAPREQVPDFLDRMMLADTLTYLPDDILCKVDRASMAVSLEARVPLLDHRVVELAWSMPQELRVGEGAGKRMLREILGRRLPSALFERPKMGFGVPISAWLRGPLRGWGEDLLRVERLERQGLLNPAPIRSRWEEHQDGRQDWGYHLWDVLVFQAWFDRWLA